MQETYRPVAAVREKEKENEKKKKKWRKRCVRMEEALLVRERDTQKTLTPCDR
jgi:hypothetical protein